MVRMFWISFKKCFRWLLGFWSLINCDGRREHLIHVLKKMLDMNSNQSFYLLVVYCVTASFLRLSCWTKQRRSGGWSSFPFYPKSFSYQIGNCYFPADDCFAFYHLVRLIKMFYFQGSHDRIIQKLQQMQLDASKVKSRTDLLLGLRKIALDRGFRISDNEGLGNCMFYALSEQLEIVKGIKISHGELRQNLVQYLRRYPKLVSWC